MAIPINPKVLARLRNIARLGNSESERKEEVLTDVTISDLYDVKIYKPDGRETSTVRGLTYSQAYALVTGLNDCFVKSVVNLIT